MMQLLNTMAKACTINIMISKHKATTSHNLTI